MSSIQYIPLGESGFRCTVVITSSITRHLELVIHDVMSDAAADLSGDQEFQSNSALLSNLLNYGSHEFAYRTATDADEKKAAQKQAARHSKAALQLAEFISQGWYKTQRGWCSSCFTLTEHREVEGNFLPSVSLCTSCGESTTACAGSGCKNMARRPHGVIRVPPYCAEHRHEIRSFERADRTYASLDDIDDLRTYDKANLRGLTRAVAVAGASAVVMGPAVFFAAPAIGGALGASGLIGPALSGAAATGHGLAFLGGGTLAAGGLGMAGGTAVVTASGVALGGTLGAVTASAYLRADKSFSIERLKEGSGIPVIVASGFLTEKDSGWGPWERIVTERYPHNPVYRVHWGAKELAGLGLAFAGSGGRAALGVLAKSFGGRATVSISRGIPVIGAVVVASDIMRNPWTVAKRRAELTAAVLADLLARVEGGKFILVGHSLGARMMLCTAEILATKPGPPRLESIHLLGAAEGVNGNWKALHGAVTDGLWNYHSAKDKVLRYLYRTVQGGQKSIGEVGFRTLVEKVTDVDVSASVDNHGKYFEVVSLAGASETVQSSES